MKNPISNLFKYAKIHGWKKTLADWKYNYLMLDTPDQLLKKEIIGYIGTMGALLLAMVILTYKNLWYISLIMLFSLWIAYVQFKGKLKSLHILKNASKMAEEIEDQFRQSEEE